MSTHLLWLRRDLRLENNAALLAACKSASRLLIVYIHEPTQRQHTASDWWLHQSLAALATELGHRTQKLILCQGQSADQLLDLCRKHAINHVFWNRLYEPQTIARDSHIKQLLQAQNIAVSSHNNGLLNEPWTIEKPAGGAYKIFTAYWQRCLQQATHGVLENAPKQLPPPLDCQSLPLTTLNLLAKTPWYQHFAKYWQPGESNTLNNMTQFSSCGLGDYANARDQPAIQGTSRLAPGLHFGEVSAQQLQAHYATQTNSGAFIRQIYWREFAYHLLFHFPESSHQALNPKFASFPWRSRYASDLANWQQGLTGIPIIDAGMRELWHSGWMHNRVRMLTASFLTKNLLIPWQEGANWFMQTLLDADLANNSMGWQWVAGCGVDAAPYFRIFNPVTQSKKFDPDGHYLRHWLPELNQLDSKHIHAPWEAPPAILSAAGVKLGKNYPRPLVDLSATRQRALDHYRQLKH